MNTNFNMVKKPKTEDIEIDEEVEDEPKNNKSSNNNIHDDVKKRMIIVMGAIVGGVVLLLLILFILSLTIQRTQSYSDIEKIMTNAAKEYFKDNQSYLPTDEGGIVEVDVSNLVAGEYMKNLSEYTKEGVTCSGTVQVEKSGNDFLYIPYLNCGEAYNTEELYKKVVSDENIVSSGYGLYSRSGSYVFRGEEVNNYVKLDKSLWRIVKVNSNNNIVLVRAEGLQESQPWDDRYNEVANYNAGINNYSASRLKEYLDKIYTNPSSKDNEVILSKNDKSKLVSFNMCTGKKNESSSSFDNVEECSDHLTNQMIGLLTASDYAVASIDPNCKTITSESCQNYNYLNIDAEWWLATADPVDTLSVYKVGRNDSIKVETAGTYAAVRPVVYLNNKVLYKSGNGTLKKPYKIK